MQFLHHVEILIRIVVYKKSFKSISSIKLVYIYKIERLMLDKGKKRDRDREGERENDRKNFIN